MPMCLASPVYSNTLILFLYDNCSRTNTIKYKTKLIDETTLEESPEEGSIFFVNEGNCVIIFAKKMKGHKACSL